MWIMGENRPTDLHSSRWHCQTRWTIRMLMCSLRAAMTPCTSCINLVDFWLVSSELTKRDSTVYRRRQSAPGLIHVRSLGGGTARHCADLCTVLFRYCPLGGDTAMPGGLHARLCQAFLVFLFNTTWWLCHYFSPNWTSSSCNDVTH